jgi:hypothetical protein
MQEKQAGLKVKCGQALCAHLDALVAGEHIGHLAAVEDVVDVLNEPLVLDLRGGMTRDINKQ